MLIFDKRLENYVDRAIKEQCDAEKALKRKRIGCHFLFGSTLAEDILVAHASPCPLADAITSGEAAADQQIDPEWVADYGVRANRLLPGGVRIVGLLMIADKSFNSELRSFSRALSFIAKTSDALYSNIDSLKMAFVTVECPLGVPKVVVTDVKNKSEGERPSKLAYNPLSWVSVSSTAQFNLSVPLPPEDASKDFYSQFKAALSRFSKKLLTDETCLVDGKALSADECPIGKASKKSQCQVELVIGGSGECEETAIVFTTQVEILVDLNIAAAVPTGSPARAIVLAAKEGLLKTLYHRADLHHESTEIVEDEGQDQLSIHQLPRVASASIPDHPQIKVGECLFEKDNIEDARDSFRQLLSLDLEICDDEERHLNEGDLAKFSTGMQNEIVGSVAKKTQGSSSMDSSLIIGAFVFALLAVLLFLGFKFLV